MHIEKIESREYRVPMANGGMRNGILINLIAEGGESAWGEIAPLPKWSRETLDEAVQELRHIEKELRNIYWNAHSCLQELGALKLLPSVHFGIESALLTLLTPLPAFSVPASALLMGTLQEILQQASARSKEGFTVAKLKVSNLSPTEAAEAISLLKDTFRLRIDVNRAWETEDALRFFEQFPLDSFDYVEEPFRDPRDLALFPHPLAVDESFPGDLDIADLEKLPTMKALIYKPTIQGGLLGCLKLLEWTKSNNIQMVLSSSFESDIGLRHIAAMAKRLTLSSPIGIGTYHHMEGRLGNPPLRIDGALACIDQELELVCNDRISDCGA